MHFRFNGMNHHRFCVLREFLHGNWSHLCLPLLQTPSQPKEPRDHGLPFCLQQCLILLCKVSCSYTISLFCYAVFFSTFLFSVHQAYGNHQLNLHLSHIVNMAETSIHHPNSILPQLTFLVLVGISLLPTSQYIGLIGRKTL